MGKTGTMGKDAASRAVAGVWECGSMGVWEYGSVGVWRLAHTPIPPHFLPPLAGLLIELRERATCAEGRDAGTNFGNHAPLD